MKIPTRPPHPERTCWGCDRYCPADRLGCANGTVRTQHPCELFGDDWLEWAEQRTAPTDAGRPGQVTEPADPTAARRP
jgi:hypothetical protein